MAKKTLEMCLQQTRSPVPTRAGPVPGEVLGTLCVQGDASYFTRRTAKSWRGLVAMTLWIRRKVSMSVTLRRKLQETVEGALGSNVGF